MAAHSSVLAWRIPWTEESDRLQSIGLQSVGHNWATERPCPCHNTICWISKLIGGKTIQRIVVVLMVTPQWVSHLWIPGNCLGMIIFGKSNFADINHFILRWGHLGLSEQTLNLMTSVLIRDMQGRLNRQEEEITHQWRWRLEWWRHRPGNTWRHLKQGGGRDQLFLWSL